MPTTVCTSCGKALKVRDELMGKRIKCPGCQATVVAGAAGPAPIKGRTRASTLGEKRDTNVPKFSVNWVMVGVGLLILTIPAIVIGWKVGPGATNAKWAEQVDAANDEVESVVDFLLQAYTSNEGSYNPNKAHQIPRSTDKMFIFPPFEWSMPERVEFKGASTEGEFKGWYHPATHEVEVTLDVGGTGLSTGIVTKKGTKTVQGTGRLKGGKVSGEINGKKTEIYFPPKDPDDK